MASFFDLFRQLGQVFQWWVIVAPWEQALRVRAGKRVAILVAGLHLRIPFIDAVYRQSVRLRVASLPTQTVVTADGKLLTIGANLGYAIADIRRLYDTLHHAQDTVVNLAAQAVAQYTASVASQGLTPEKLSGGATALLTFDRFGLAQSQIRVTDFAFVRTYRLISDQRWGNFGDMLQTHVSDGPSGGGPR